ncbi:MAG: 1-phosphofructokinase family hexose kinase [Candidatus Bipolaricaulota bacterium]
MDQILTLTMNPAVDKSSAAPQVTPEEKIRCFEPSFEPGGGGLNVSRAIEKLGGASTSILPAGGTTGDLLKTLLENYPLDTKIVDIQASTRENLTVLAESLGIQYRFVMPGPEISPEELLNVERTLEEFLPGTDYLVISGSLPRSVEPDFYARVIQAANNKKTEVILDTSGEPLKSGLAEGVFLVKPNVGELAKLAGSKIPEEPQQIASARKLIEEGQTEVVVISAGAAGAFLVTEGESTHFRSPTVPIISKVGAGDSMVAGITYGLADGRELDESVRLGVAAGASAVMTSGTELCRQEDTFRLFGQIHETRVD